MSDQLKTKPIFDNRGRIIGQRLLEPILMSIKLSGIITGKQIKELFASVADEQLVDISLANPDGSVDVIIGSIERVDELGASAAFRILPPEGYILTIK